MTELFASLLLLLLTPLSVIGLLQLTEAMSKAARAVLRAETIQAEAQKLLRAEQQLAQVQRLSEAAVSGGTQTVRAIHKGIAAIPFGILESIPATRDTTRLVRKSHDLISDAIYGSIGAVNRGVGAKLREGLQSGAVTPDTVRKPSEPPKDS